MVRPPPIVTSHPPQNENRGYGPALDNINKCQLIIQISITFFTIIGIDDYVVHSDKSWIPPKKGFPKIETWLEVANLQ